MKAKEIIIKSTDGLCRTAVNGVLWWMYLSGASIFQSPTTRGTYKIFTDADKALNDFNYDSFKQIFLTLKQKEYVKKTRTTQGWKLEITDSGLRHLEDRILVYKEKRSWDGYLYLISYDIPEKYHYARDLLRKYLKKNSCAILQESLWITPYNPTKMIEAFIKEKMPSVVLFISKMGKEGAIGYKNRKELIEEVFDLTKVNEKYKDLINEYKNRKISMYFAKSRFYSILSNDPQLPDKFLPKDWKGKEAYKEIIKGV
ncbi:PaaX family transcriptional regulator C-terminal domain-containing protein [Patescibacteria group bacterium]